MSDPNSEQPNAEQESDGMPSNAALEEPSAEKEVEQEPQAARPHDPEPDHQAVGIGVIGGPQSDTEADADSDDVESPDAEQPDDA